MTSTSSAPSNAVRFLEAHLGVKQSEERPDPSIPRGILQTRDYKHFELRSDTGDVLVSFEGASTANRCLPGDHVYWEGNKCHLELRDEHPLLVGTIELTRPARYGFTSRKIPLVLFTPYDERYPQMVVGCSERDLSKNRIGVVQWTEWSPNTQFPRAALQNVWGVSGDIEVEKRALQHCACPWKYPKHPYAPVLHDAHSRTPLKGYTFHIDPAGCRDVDDVFTLERVDDTLWRVTITISDVSAFVEDGDAVDIMASLISQTLYDTKGVVLSPMLPAAYSEESCSLLPNKTSYGLSLQFLWNGTEISECCWIESVFETTESFTYEGFQKRVTPYQRVIQEVASFISGEALQDSHEWVEQLMIFYNKEAGRYLKRTGKGILRRHSLPDQERLAHYRVHLPEWKHLAMSSAEYCLAEEKDTYHSGLETDAYAHATSPIRRYADFVNQRALKQILRGGDELFIVPVTMYDLNRREKAIKQFHREMTFLEAMETGQSSTTAIVLTMERVQGEMWKIKWYVPAWKKTVSSVYQMTETPEPEPETETEPEKPANGRPQTKTMHSRDGDTLLEVSEFKVMHIQCAIQWSAQSWKRRLLIQPSNL